MKRIWTLFLLWRVWRQHKNWRLCQAIVNVTDRNDPFYCEDAYLREWLREWL